MKKILLSLAALLLSVSAVNAQSIISSEGFANRLERSPQAGLRVLDKAKKAPSAMNKISLADNERILGFYDTDELPDADGGLGMPDYPGDLKAGVIFPESVIEPFAGGKIKMIRFGLAYTVGASRVFIAKVENNGNISEVASVDVPTTKVGWNEATLSEPFTIEAGAEYLMGFDYTQSNKNDGQYYDSECFPLLADGRNAVDDGFMLYGSFGQGEGWYRMNNADLGNLCLQAVVEKDDYAEYDLVVSSLVLPKFAKGGNDLKYSFNIRKMSGTKVPSSYTLEVSVDGKVVSTLENPVSLTDSYQTYEGTVSTSDLSAGSHTVKVEVASINGAAPDPSTTSNDAVEASTTLFTSEGLPHTKSLIEHFTSQYCTYCPLGYNVLNNMMEKRDDLAWVSIHCDMQSGSDIYTIDDAMYITVFAGGGLPGAAFNRYYVTDTDINSYGSLAVGLGFREQYASQAADMMLSVIDESNEMPAFATVDIATTVDKSANKLNIKVSGTVLEDFKSMFGDDAALTVYVTESGLKARQLNNGSWIQSYDHNHVLRAIASSPLGDALVVNGDKYENDYTVNLNSSWNTDNMEVVAFIAKPLELNAAGNAFATAVDDANVHQVNSVKAGETVITGIKNVTSASDESGVEVARYSIDGTRLSAPVKGINLVKLSNGKTIKVLVKD